MFQNQPILPVSPKATEERSDEGSGGETAQLSSTPESVPDPEIEARPARRRFTAKYKLAILEQADACSSREEVGSLLRREGLYSSHLSNWRLARRRGSLAALGKRRGRKPKRHPLESKVARLEREKTRLEREKTRLEREKTRLENELHRAQLIIDVQRKVAGLLGIPSEGEKNS